MEDKYILWTNDGLEGWIPHYFETLSEIATWIEQGNCHTSFKLTKAIRFELIEKD